MAKPEVDRDDVQIALGGFVIAGGDAAGVLEFVEAALDQSSQPVEGAVHGHAQLAGFAHRDHLHHVACLQGLSNLIRVIAAICRRDARLLQVVVHDQIEAQIV